MARPSKIKDSTNFKNVRTTLKILSISAIKHTYTNHHIIAIKIVTVNFSSKPRQFTKMWKLQPKWQIKKTFKVKFIVMPNIVFKFEPTSVY